MKCYLISANGIEADIDFLAATNQGQRMKKRFASIAIGLWVAMSTTTASADCFADYKAKQESPLRLHYGVIEVDAQPCSLSGAITRIVEQRLAAGGWMLLQVESVFDETGLEGRKKDAGQFYLRY